MIDDYSKDDYSNNLQLAIASTTLAIDEGKLIDDEESNNNHHRLLV